MLQDQHPYASVPRLDESFRWALSSTCAIHLEILQYFCMRFASTSVIHNAMAQAELLPEHNVAVEAVRVGSSVQRRGSTWLMQSQVSREQKLLQVYEVHGSLYPCL